MSKVIIHVNRNILAHNKKHNCNDPPIVIRRGKKREYSHRVEIKDREGNVVAQVIHSEKPLDCGARVWIEVL